jgi:ATP-dependent DNA ligase
MGLEGLVSKYRERVCRGGRCDHWVKVKNRI